MESLVASEHVFSSAGITINKHHSWLNGDIIKVLQYLKSLKAQDIMLRAYPSLIDEEISLDDVDLQLANQEGTMKEIVNKAKEWSLEAVIKGSSNEDMSEDNANEVIMVG